MKPIPVGSVKETMSTTEKLEKAIDLIKEAESLLKEVKENKSLDSYYGYTLELISSQLNIITGNSRHYVTGDTTLEEILGDEGTNWNNNGEENEED